MPSRRVAHRPLGPDHELAALGVLTEAGELIKLTSMVGAMERRPAPTMWLPRGIPKGYPLIAQVEVLGDEAPLQTVRVPFNVAGPIVKQAVSDDEVKG